MITAERTTPSLVRVPMRGLASATASATGLTLPPGMTTATPFVTATVPQEEGVVWVWVPGWKRETPVPGQVVLPGTLNGLGIAPAVVTVIGALFSAAGAFFGLKASGNQVNAATIAAQMQAQQLQWEREKAAQEAQQQQQLLLWVGAGALVALLLWRRKKAA